MLCPKCGVENPASRAFCRSCAQDLWPALKAKSSLGASAAAVHPPSVAGMPVAAEPRELVPLVEPSVEFSDFYGVRGWLLWFCIMMTIISPLWAAAEAVRIIVP